MLLDPAEQRVHDFGKENVRRLKEIQKRCKEQEAEKAQARPVPVKALWTAPKYQHVSSRVLAQLEARTTLICHECNAFELFYMKVRSVPLM